jgi:hypothetical protein
MARPWMSAKLCGQACLCNNINTIQNAAGTDALMHSINFFPPQRQHEIDMPDSGEAAVTASPSE